MALPTSMAAYQRPENPPPRPPSGATTTTAPRDGAPQLTLIAPQQHVGYAVNTQPTFTWFVPTETTVSGEFALYEIIDEGALATTVGASGTEMRTAETIAAGTTGEETTGRRPTVVEVLSEPHEFVSEPGFMSLDWSDEMPELKPNTSYVWQVLLRYGDRPGEAVQMRAQIEILEADSYLPALLSTDVSTQVGQLAASGLWYDALTLAATLPAAESHAKRAELLQNLAEIELTEINMAEAALTESLENSSPASISETDVFRERIRITHLRSNAQALSSIASLEEEERLSSLLHRLH
ncbi:MAG: DUF928 domain-containing protein [Cyanobacteria bacterium J06621_11]